ncbi:sugar ABC transporter substrate-binding protein [Streptomyces sp. 150FB]|uniref:ABC transporter substrate-binding protein n=1 Tax=Streptomyces sp. 150FB TaxID=1576605 RepID=UPI0005892FEF|nr:extracellular solute-binding protein [Streptomyces sp. 150FB]KIF77509.1 sugar ABC transporter substrate-binding protein [Streptomyces sp. 150FB]
MRRRVLPAVSLAAAIVVVGTACSSSGSGGSTSTAAATAAADPSSVSGDITVLTNRTDLIGDGTLKKYAADFKKLYPKVNVKFQGLTDYEGEVKIRMNTENYGDVLLIPTAVARTDYPKFFAPLGDSADLAGTYQFTDSGTVDGKVYGIVSFASANGFVYNKKVWQQAGITSWPTTPAQFLADLKQIKSRTEATPYYTNYKDGWPLTAWTNVLGSATCDPGANDKLTTDDPWKAGSDLNTGDSLLYDIVHSKLSEDDPTTTNWENSKNLLATGKAATMWLGTWSVPQLQQAATKAGADPKDIGYMPFPAQVGGKYCSVEAPDYQYAVNIHSSHKEAARAWVDWIEGKSGFATSVSGISSAKGSALPEILAPFTAAGVKMIVESQARTPQVNTIDKASEVGLQTPEYRQKLIDAARGAGGGSLSSIFSDLSKKWKSGQQNAGL